MRAEELLPRTLIRGVRLVPIDGTKPLRDIDRPLDLRIRGGRVVEVGPGLTAQRGDGVHDAHGRWAIPGLWDQHVHLTQWALALVRLDTSGTTSAEAVVERVRREVVDRDARVDHASTIIGYGHRSATWPRTGTVAELDAVSGEHPVALVSGDAHHGWLNSAALQLLGVVGATGPVEEEEWFPLIGRLEELPGVVDGEGAVADAVDRAAALGVVGITDMEFRGAVTGWPERFAAGVTGLRVRAATYAAELGDVLAAGLRTGDPLGQDVGDAAGQLEMGPFKLITDGSLNTRTAHCCEPYVDAGTGRTGTSRGLPNATPDELRELFARASSAGLRVAAHAIGDAAVAALLDTFEATRARGTVEHAQLVRFEDLHRMARLGVVASVQPAHLVDDRDVTEACWPDRAGRCFALRAMFDAGVRLAMGSDAPVAPLDPWLMLATAVHRSGDEREPWHPEQAITPAQALAASTDRQGTLNVGSRGDVVLVDDDPLGVVVDLDDPATTSAAASRLRGMPVSATFLAGRPTHLAL